MDLHLRSPEEHLKKSDLLTDVIIGMSDGLTVPFALIAGLSGVVASNSIIAVAGIAVVAAGSIAMGLGGFHAGKTEEVRYQADLKREYEKIEKVPDVEKKETKSFFANIGLSEEMQEKATEDIVKDKKQWADFMMKYELGVDKPDPQRATKSGLNIGIAYAVGGLVAVSPYFFVHAPTRGLQISAIITLLCLFIFGYFKSKIAGVNPFWGAARVTLIGALAAGAAFGVARLFVQ